MSDPRRIPDTMLEEIRARLPILDVVARSVVLRKAGAWHKGLCPFHAEKSPSFAVNTRGRSYHCFGCGAHGDVITFVQRREGLSFPDAARRCAAEAGLASEMDGAVGAAPWVHRAPAQQAAPVARDDAMKRIGAAWRIWDRAKPIAADGVVVRYLRGRGLRDVEQLAPVLRCAMLKHPDTGDALHPVMIARCDGPGGKFAGVHRTFLAKRADGSVGKLQGVENAKLTLGDLTAAAVRLHPVGSRLGVAEGIETAIAVWNLSGVETWATINTSNMKAAQLPFEVGELIVFADRDKPHPKCPEGWGLRAARALCERVKAEAVRCDIRLPITPHGDYADVAAARMTEAAPAA